MTIDINSNSKTFSKQLSVPSLNETTTIRSLAISFSRNTITLYLDCKDVLKEEVEFNLSKLFLDMEEPMVKLFRERKYPLFLDTLPENALSRASCQKQHRKSNHKIVKDNERRKYFEGKQKFRNHECYWHRHLIFIDCLLSHLKDRKRIGSVMWINIIEGMIETEILMSYQAVEIFQSCMAIVMVKILENIFICFLFTPVNLISSENLLRSINNLIALIKKLQQDIANQHADIRRLQSLIENCAGCKEPPPLRLPSCANANPCFPGKNLNLFNLHLMKHHTHTHTHTHKYLSTIIINLFLNLFIYCLFVKNT